MKMEYAEHVPELDTALNCGMYRKEMYSRIDWACVDLKRRDLYVPASKNGKSRHFPLNEAALDAFRELRLRTGGKGPIFAGKGRGKSIGNGRSAFESRG